MKYFFFFLLFSLRLSACDCDVPKPVMEFYDAEFVFEGVVVTKNYNEDLETYSIAFKVKKHYKDGTRPRVLRFTLPSEELYTDSLTSCDWTVEVGEKWLVYAHRDKKGVLKFNYYCSNSKKLDFSKISESEKEILENGNDFILENYIYENEIGFTNPSPLINIDSIVKQGKKANYKNTFTIIKLYIDEQGTLQSVTTNKDYKALKVDTTFNLPYSFETSSHSTLSDFEQEALRLSRKMKKWEVKRHKKSNVSVSYIKSVIFQYDKKEDKWSCEI